ncbi:MAG: YicC family protein [Gemmatimonadetes bacterium]|nr:YicC family protein [Gemmatimonadota bacterium]MBK8062082.1 YicC family protein [Gemmatimonadota bacterium]MBK9978846.1 YicC family protein [Gemmatimonadota bacterium]
MTGFGVAEGTVGAARVAVEIRSVNHRFFNATIRLPSELGRWETEVREALRKRVTRGHISLTARVERGVAGAPAIDETRFGAYVELLRRLQARYQLDGEIDVAAVLRMPDVMSSISEGEDGDVGELLAIVDASAQALSASREEEGERLAVYLLERLAIVEGALSRIAERAPTRLLEQRERLRASVRELAQGVAVDEGRLAMEIAVLADRLDVQEELSRFKSHNTAFRQTLSRKDGEPVGKRLGFLLQEMLREANTTGSKSNDAAMLADVVTIKEELERIREQVENLE